MGQNCQFLPYLKIIFQHIEGSCDDKNEFFGTFLFSIGHGPMYMNIIFRSPIVDREQKRTNPISLLDLDWLVEVRRDFRRLRAGKRQA